MAARVGVTRADVVEAAVAVIEETPHLDAVTLGAVARRLSIKPQSLYSHVDGADGLRVALAVVALEELAAEVTQSSIGVSGAEAVAAIVRAHLAYARRRPALYEAALQPPSDDPDHRSAVAAVSAPLQIVLRGAGCTNDAVVHWTRLFLSSVYGYTALQRTGSFTLPADTTITEDRLVEMLASVLDDQLAAQPA